MKPSKHGLFDGECHCFETTACTKLESFVTLFKVLLSVVIQSAAQKLTHLFVFLYLQVISWILTIWVCGTFFVYLLARVLGGSVSRLYARVNFLALVLHVYCLIVLSYFVLQV